MTELGTSEIYTVGHPDIIVFGFIENSIGLKREKLEKQADYLDFVILVN